MLVVRQLLVGQQVIRRDDSPRHPLVSIVLPTHARCRSGLLQRAVESVLRQTMPDFELIVMDDGSRDGTADLIQRYQQRDRRVIHVRHEKNCGLPAVRVNEGIELARAEQIAFQFDDDEWLPECLETLTAASAEFGEPTFVWGQCRLIGPGTELLFPDARRPMHLLRDRNFAANNAVLVPRSFFDRFGMYDPHLAMRRLCDWDLWTRLLVAVPYHFVLKEITRAYGEQEGSLGVTVNHDEGLHRAIAEIPRNALLTPAKWRDYPVDSLRIGETDLVGELRRICYEQMILPFYQRFRHLFGFEQFAHNLPPDARSAVLIGSGPVHIPATLPDHRVSRIIEATPRTVELADLVIATEDTEAERQTLRAAREAGRAVASYSETTEAIDAQWSHDPATSAHPRTLFVPPTDDGNPSVRHRFQATLRATELHARTRSGRGPDGRPCVLLAPTTPDATEDEMSLWLRRADLLGQFGIEAVATCAEDSPWLGLLSRHGIATETYPAFEADTVPGGDVPANVALEAILQRHRPFVVETFGNSAWIGAVGRRWNLPVLTSHPGEEFATQLALRCREAWSCDPKIALQLPLTATFYLGDARWYDPFGLASALGLRWRYLPGWVRDDVFAVGRQRLTQPPRAAGPLRVLLAADDRSRQPIRTALAGAEVYDARILVQDPEASLDILRRVDLVIAVDGPDCVPQAIKEGLAAGVLVVAAPSRALRELLHDGQTALFAPTNAQGETDWPAAIQRALALSASERQAILERAARLSATELGMERFADDLLTIYLSAMRPVRAPNPARATVHQAGRVVEMLTPGVRYGVHAPAPGWSEIELWTEWVGTEPAAVHLRVFNPAGRVVRQATALAVPGSGPVRLHFWFEALPSDGLTPFEMELLPIAGATVESGETRSLGRQMVEWHRREEMPEPIDGKRQAKVLQNEGEPS